MAARSRRANAGSRIGKLIEQEIGKDDFYSTAYGGFEEASEDEEYETEEEYDDVVDSDFDLSEKDEPNEGDEEDLQPKAKKRKWIKPFKAAQSTSSKQPPKQHKKQEKNSDTSSFEPRALRKSTIEVGKERERSRLVEEKNRLKSSLQRLGSQPKKVERLTQDQLLREAKRTEVRNLASLETYRLQSEKKTYKEKKHSIEGAVVRYHSVVMPCTTVDEVGPVLGPQKESKYSRNFVIFTDNDLYYSTFAHQALHRPKRVYCSITGLPAKYIDPLTKQPYATAQAFKIIRNRYVKEKEDKCEERIMQLNNWLEEKKKLKSKTC